MKYDNTLTLIVQWFRITRSHRVDWGSIPHKSKTLICNSFLAEESFYFVIFKSIMPISPNGLGVRLRGVSR
jgi:hypothetical protein